MPRNDDGEFELILGNRQLLSVFFIVVILLGVFFTMGYIVGRNSSPLTAEARKSDRPLVVDATTRPNPSGAAPATSEPASPPPVDPGKPIPVSPSSEAPAPDSARTQPARPADDKPQPASPVPDQPAPGEMYLQLTAVAKAEAQLFVDVLAKKGFHAIYAVVPEKPQVYRVLVGPIKDAGAVNQTRSDLEKAGFQGLKAIVRKF